MTERQRGFSLITALFLIVIVSLLVAVGVRIGFAAQQTLDAELLGARALAAATAGVEYAAQRALGSSVCGSTTFAMTEGALRDFQVSVTCSLTTHSVGSSTVQVFAIDSFAATGTYGQAGYATRRVRAQFTTGDT
jgi:MSHA biogenesis protein MshP